MKKRCLEATYWLLNLTIMFKVYFHISQSQLLWLKVLSHGSVYTSSNFNFVDEMISYEVTI